MRTIKVSDDVKIYTVNSLRELQDIFVKFPSNEGVGGWLYRGQANKDWSLIPKAGRDEFNFRGGSDLSLFAQWRDRAVAYQTLPSGDLECLAIAQHHGLATRLLDWSNNPLIATYFACKHETHKDAAIYLYFPRNLIDAENLKFEDIKGDYVQQYIPRSIASRIIRQSGRFTYHLNHSIPLTFGDIGEPFIGQRLKKIIVPSQVKGKIIDELNLYGINEEGIFPDLDGLSRYINWLAPKSCDSKTMNYVNFQEEKLKFKVEHSSPVLVDHDTGVTRYYVVGVIAWNLILKPLTGGLKLKIPKVYVSDVDDETLKDLFPEYYI